MLLDGGEGIVVDLVRSPARLGGRDRPVARRPRAARSPPAQPIVRASMPSEGAGLAQRVRDVVAVADEPSPQTCQPAERLGMSGGRRAPGRDGGVGQRVDHRHVACSSKRLVVQPFTRATTSRPAASVSPRPSCSSSGLGVRHREAVNRDLQRHARVEGFRKRQGCAAGERAPAVPVGCLVERLRQRQDAP